MDDDCGAVRGNIREVGWDRVSHGLFLPGGGPEDEELEWRRVLAAWMQVVPPGGCFTGLTGARLREWWLPPLPDWVPVFVSVPIVARGPRRAGLVVSRPGWPDDHATDAVHGLPVDSPAEVLLRCARELGVLDLLPMMDSAVRAGDIDREALRRLGDSGRPGAPRIRTALVFLDPRSESPWESVLRFFHRTMEVEVDVQPRIEDAAGRFVCRADLRVRGTSFLHEYDGAVHRGATTHADDLRRDRRVTEAGYVRRGYTAADLLRRAGSTMVELDRALGRRTRVARLRRWHALVAGSALSETGRERLRNRWVRPMGVSEWSRTAG